MQKYIFNICKKENLTFWPCIRHFQAAARDDLKKALTVSELEVLLRANASSERDVGAIEAETKKVNAEVAEVMKPFAKSSNSQTDALIKQINKKLVSLKFGYREIDYQTFCHKIVSLCRVSLKVALVKQDTYRRSVAD